MTATTSIEAAGIGDLLIDPFQQSHPRLLRVLDAFHYKAIKMVYVHNGEAEYWLADAADGPRYYDSLDFAIRELRRG